MSIVKRNVNDETFGQNLSDVTVIAFQNQIHCDASIISAEREEIRAHQVCFKKYVKKSTVSSFYFSHFTWLFYRWFWQRVLPLSMLWGNQKSGINQRPTFFSQSSRNAAYCYYYSSCTPEKLVWTMVLLQKYVSTYVTCEITWIVYIISLPDLISASELLVEFQELCRILKLNPQVKKTKYVEGSVVSGKYIHLQWVTGNKFLNNTRAGVFAIH